MIFPLFNEWCTQTVTVYRKTKDGICRQVIPNCYLHWQEQTEYDDLGNWCNRCFLLVQTGEEQLVFAGDRVYEGVGPEIGEDAWDAFVPEAVPLLGIAAYAEPYCWQGGFSHTEAGRRRGIR